jgi:hypothetical protein
MIRGIAIRTLGHPAAIDSRTTQFEPQRRTSSTFAVRLPLTAARVLSSVYRTTTLP